MSNNTAQYNFELMLSIDWQLNNDIARLSNLPLAIRRVIILNWHGDTRETPYNLVYCEHVVGLMQQCEPIEMMRYFINTASPERGGMFGVFAAVDCYIHTYTKLQ